jgi:hypothetical protein
VYLAAELLWQLQHLKAVPELDTVIKFLQIPHYLPVVQVAAGLVMADLVKHFYQQELVQLVKDILADTAVTIMVHQKAHTTVEVEVEVLEHRDIIEAGDTDKLEAVKDRPVVSADL